MKRVVIVFLASFSMIVFAGGPESEQQQQQQEELSEQSDFFNDFMAEFWNSWSNLTSAADKTNHTSVTDSQSQSKTKLFSCFMPSKQILDLLTKKQENNSDVIVVAEQQVPMQTDAENNNNNNSVQQQPSVAQERSPVNDASENNTIDQFVQKIANIPNLTDEQQLQIGLAYSSYLAEKK